MTPQKTGRGIRKWPETERPRERLLRECAESLSDAQLFAILLRVGRREASAVKVGMEVLDRVGGIFGLLHCSAEELCAIAGVGPAQAARLKAAVEVGTRAVSAPLTTGSRAFSEQLFRIRDIHIEVESILQSLAALQDDLPCASCARVCCKEVMCRESLDSDFLRFLLGPLVEAYSVEAGWYVPGAGCRLRYGRPLVCYEFFCEKFEGQGWTQPKQLSRALKTLYSNVFAGQHMLGLEDISRITENKLNIIYVRLEKLRDLANELLRRSLSEKLGMQSTRSPVDPQGFRDRGRLQPE